MKRASTWLGPGALPSALSRADWRSCMEYCWTLAQAPSGTQGMWRLRTAWKLKRSTGRLRFEVWGLILRVLDAFRPRGATWSGQVISSPPGPSGEPSKTHLLPGGGVPRDHRARSPVPPRLPRFATPRSVHQLAAVAAGAYPPRRPPNAWSPGAPGPPGPCYWLVASGTPLGWRGGCLG